MEPTPANNSPVVHNVRAGEQVDGLSLNVSLSTGPLPRLIDPMSAKDLERILEKVIGQQFFKVDSAVGIRLESSGIIAVLGPDEYSKILNEAGKQPVATKELEFAKGREAALESSIQDLQQKLQSKSYRTFWGVMRALGWSHLDKQEARMPDLRIELKAAQTRSQTKQVELDRVGKSVSELPECCPADKGAVRLTLRGRELLEDLRCRPLSYEAKSFDQILDEFQRVSNARAGNIRWSSGFSEGIFSRRIHGHGVAMVLNPESGLVITRKSEEAGIAGVFNPKTKEIEWREFQDGGVAGVYNPKTEQVEWMVAKFHGVAGVYNPKTENVEWAKQFMSGVALVYNPDSGLVEKESSTMAAVAGVFNPVTRKVEWDFCSKGGIAALYLGARTEVALATSSSGFYGGWSKR